MIIFQTLTFQCESVDGIAVFKTLQTEPMQGSSVGRALYLGRSLPGLNTALGSTLYFELCFYSK